MQTTFEPSTGELCVDGLPEGVGYVRAFANGIPTWRGDGDSTGSPIRIPLMDLLPRDPTSRDMLHGPDCLLQLVAYDRERNEIARQCVDFPASAEMNAVVRATAPSPPTEDRPGPVRLVASTLHRPGEKHTWRVRIADHLPAHSPTIRLVCLRACLERDAENASATVRWTHAASTEASAVRPPKRPRIARAMGEQNAVVHLEGDVAESVFHFLVGPEETEDSHATVTIEWPDKAEPIRDGLRYTVHLQLVSPLAFGASGVLPYTHATVGSASPPPPERQGKRLAVIVGVSKYSRRRGGDLEFCDEDDRRGALRVDAPRRCCVRVVRLPQGGGVRMCRTRRRVQSLTRAGARKGLRAPSGGHPVYHGPATVRNVRDAVQRMVQAAGNPEDRTVFVTSSHGNGDGMGAQNRACSSYAHVSVPNSYLVLLPDPVVGVTPCEKAGQYWDHELARDLSGGGRNRGRSFVFLGRTSAPKKKEIECQSPSRGPSSMRVSAADWSKNSYARYRMWWGRPLARAKATDTTMARSSMAPGRKPSWWRGFSRGCAIKGRRWTYSPSSANVANVTCAHTANAGIGRASSPASAPDRRASTPRRMRRRDCFRTVASR